MTVRRNKLAERPRNRVREAIEGTLIGLAVVIGAAVCLLILKAL